MKSITRFFALTVLIIITAIVAGCAMPGSAPAADAPETAVSVEAEAQPVKASDEISADAVVVPVTSATLSLPTGGIVAELLVAEGDQVEQGQPLLRLDAARQAAAVAQAEAAVLSAESRLAEFQAGPRPQEIAVAQGAVEAARAQLAKLEQGARAEDVSAAAAALAGAQAALQKVRQGPDENEFIAAQSELDNAEAARRQAQAAYDRISQHPDIGLRPESLQLEQATNAYNAAKARLNALKRSVKAVDIAAARAGVDQAQAQLDAVKATARPADLAAVQAEINRAQAQLELIEAGVRPETIAAAEADVASARAGLALAQAALEETELNAPFAGSIALLDIKVGEQVTPGSPIVRLADLSSWQIETDDLTELDVIDIQVGDTATLTFDAIPDLELSGTVMRIKDIGENKLGDITYTVVVKPEHFDGRLRWNMTAVVSIR